VLWVVISVHGTVELVTLQISNSLGTILRIRNALMKAWLPIWELLSKEFPEELREELLKPVWKKYSLC
jgi:hypothetical protein